MNLSHPARDLLGENAERLLHQLAILPHGETGNRLNQLSGASSQRSTQRVLDKLVDIGIVNATAIGNSKRYELNRSHALWPVVELALASPARVEVQIGELVRQAIGSDAVAALYGSFAHGEAGPRSDVDIVIVWPDETDKDSQDDAINTIDLRVKQLTGNVVQLVNLTRDDLKRMVAANDPLIDSWRAEARPLTHRVGVQELLFVAPQ